MVNDVYHTGEPSKVRSNCNRIIISKPACCLLRPALSWSEIETIENAESSLLILLLQER
jgi:hypothetical protein